jgi:hypothetical protein
VSAWRDDLGRELRESPIPAHRPDHFERVRERIREVSGRDAGNTAAPTGRPAPPRPAPPARRTVRFAAITACAAAVVAAVALTWSGLPGLERSRPPAATAETVLTRVQHALTGLSGIQGDVVEYGTARGRPYSHRVGSFTFTAEGDYRIVPLQQGTAYTYDARSRIARRYTIENGHVLYGEIARDLPDPGPFFSPWMGSSQVLDRSVAAYARAVIADLDPDFPATPVTWEGRTAWSVTVPEPLSGSGQSGSVRIVVDAASGYPLAVEHWSPEGDVSGTKIENVHIGSRLSPADFTLDQAAQSPLLPASERFRSMSLRQAAALGDRVTGPIEEVHGSRGDIRLVHGFAPFAPTWLPKGYRLMGVTAATNGSYLGSTGPVHDGEVASLTVVLTYRRGFDRFCVVSRWRKDNLPGSDDPFDENSVSQSTATTMPITYGSLRGEMAKVVLGLPDWPHLYITTGHDDRVSVSVAGDLTRDELLLIADSLQPAQR